MSKESKTKSLSYRVSTPEERAERQTAVNERCEYIMMLKAQGLNYAIDCLPIGPECQPRSARSPENTASGCTPDPRIVLPDRWKAHRTRH